MNEELKIILSADVGGFVDGVLKVNRSIGELETELKQFQKEIKTLKGDEFNVMSDKIKTLKANISALKSAGSSSIPPLADDLKKIAAPAAEGGQALTDLGRVASDLPFGFIAIQNNLGPLAESFGRLKTQSGGIGGALKSLGSSLIGPAGIAFGLTAVTSAVTFAIQKYGSLGNAIDALTSKNNEAISSQQTFNAEFEKGQGTTGAELITIDLLVKKLTNLKEPYKSRQEAYELLKKVQPDILEGLSKENVLSGDATTLLLANANARKEMITLKVRETAVNAVLNENAGKLLKAEDDLQKIQDKGKTLLKERQALIDLQQPGNKAVADSIAQYTKEIVFNNAAEQSLKNTVGELKTEQDKWANTLDPIISKIAEQNKKTLDIADANKKAAAAADEQARANAKSTEESLKKTKALKEEKLRTEELLLSLKKQGTLAPQANYERVKPTAGALAGEVKPFQGNLISEEMQLQINKTAEAEAAYKKYAETISGLVAPAIDSFFAGIESGKDAFTALGDSIKALVIDLVKAIIKASILSAITGAIGGGAGAGVFGVITNLLGGGLGKSMAPSFGGGVSAGGFSLNGQVTFIQRGGDLVGVLNNSNKMINRVG